MGAARHEWTSVRCKRCGAVHLLRKVCGIEHEVRYGCVMCVKRKVKRWDGTSFRR